jgi:hypothetical protein
MAKLDKDLYEELRSKGLRKRAARTAAKAAGEAPSDGAPETLRSVAEELREVVEALDERAATAEKGRRREAGKPVPPTRKPSQRGAAARMAAGTKRRPDDS